MGNYENIFEKVGKAKLLNNWEPALPKGRHRVALVKYGGKESNKDHTVFLEAEFIVLESDNPNVKLGSRHSWPWFINKPDEFGYTHARARNFLEVLQKCIDDTSDTSSFGNDLVEDFASESPNAYGLMLDAKVDQVLDAKGEPRRGKKGQEVFNVSWIPVTQSPEQIATTREILDELLRPSSKPPQKVAAVVPAVAVTEPIKNRLGGLATLLGRPR